MDALTTRLDETAIAVGLFFSWSKVAHAIAAFVRAVIGTNVDFVRAIVGTDVFRHIWFWPRAIAGTRPVFVLWHIWPRAIDGTMPLFLRCFLIFVFINAGALRGPPVEGSGRRGVHHGAMRLLTKANADLLACVAPFVRISEAFGEDVGGHIGAFGVFKGKNARVASFF